MSTNNKDSSFAQFPSIFSSSLIASELDPLNELSIKFIMEEKLSIVMDLPFESKLQVPKLSLKRQLSQQLLLLQLRRNTSLEQILIENHKNILLVSLNQYFQAIGHTLISQLNLTVQQASFKAQNLKAKQMKLEEILRSVKIQKKQEKQMIQRFKHNLDESNLIYDILSRCPQKISFQIIYLISSIFSACDSLINNFKRKTISSELRNIGIETAKVLIDDKRLTKLFQVQNNPQKIQKSFEILIEKCLISLFLMKVGIFENELQTKTVEECLKSQVFRQITLNDLMNQHLLRPTKKRKTE